MTLRTISGSAIDCVLPWKAIVGESPVWHATEQRLYWIDIQGKQVHRFDPVSKRNESFLLPEIVTCIAMRAKGGLILTLKKSFAFFDPATNHLERYRMSKKTCHPTGSTTVNAIPRGASGQARWMLQMAETFR